MYFFALKKHDSRTLSAALAWRLWGWLEYRGSFFLRLIDRVVTLLPELIAQKWKKLRAYRYNGSAFARYALETGAAAVVMDQGGVADKRVVRVPDARQALYCFARDHRLRQKVKVIGVTGSCGKTTTKEYIAHVLATHFKVVSTEGSFNTYEGLCLALLRIRPETDFAVLEISSSGENDVEGKARIACPDYAVITVIGKAHLLGFGGVEGVRAVKRRLFDVCMERGGVLFVNDDDPVIVELAGGYANVRRYGSSGECDVWGGVLEGKVPLEIFWEAKGLGRHQVQTRIFGALNLPNLLAAIAVAKEVGVPEDKIDRGLAGYEPANMRSQLIRFGDVTCILDAYNANPTSVDAALRDFNGVAGHRTVILGDMLELGSYSLREHSSVVDKLKSSDIEAIYLVGNEFGRVVSEGFRGVWFSDVVELAEALREKPLRNTTVLIKGSRGMELERLLTLWD